MLTNVSLRVEETDSPDTFNVLGRGELQLAILIEMMRRESYELMVGKPEIVTRTIDGKLMEPVERLTDRCSGRVCRRGHGKAWRTQGPDSEDEQPGIFARERRTEARPRAHRIPRAQPRLDRIAQRTADRYARDDRDELAVRRPYRMARGHSSPAHRRAGGRSCGSDDGIRLCSGLQERGELFVGPGVEVYEGMVIGENSRDNDLDVNCVREKKMTNMRASTADDAVRLVPHRHLNLEQAIEFIAEDEYVEVTPKSLRLRKKILQSNRRPRKHALVEKT